MSCKVSNLNVCYLVDETKSPIKLNFDVDISNDVLTYNIYRFTGLEYTQEVTNIIQVPQLREGVYFHELIWLRDNVTRVVFQGNLEVRKKGSDKCNCQNSEENNVVINVEEYTINVSFSGGSGSGQDGVSLEYQWRGTELGVKRDDEEDFQFVDLKGQDGNQSDIDFYNILDEEILYRQEEHLTEDLASGKLKVGSFNNSFVINSSANNWRYFSLPVTAGQKYRYQGFPSHESTGNMYAFLKRADNTNLALKFNPNTTSGKLVEEVIEIPEDGTLYVDSRYTSNDYLRLSFAESFFEDVTGTLRGYIDRCFTNKKWMAIGDSITWASGNGSNGKGYTSYLQDWIDFKDVIVNGYSGYSLAYTPAKSCIIEQRMSWVYSDIYTLLSGTNDFKLNTPLGNQDDYINNTGYTTFYGALRMFVDRCFDLNIKCDIVLIGTTQRNNSGYTSLSANTEGHKLRDYLDAMKWVADRESLKYVDLYQTAGINMRNVSQYTTDGLHPNELGYLKIAKALKTIFLEII